jgi:hypothetical protein
MLPPPHSSRKRLSPDSRDFGAAPYLRHPVPDGFRSATAMPDTEERPSLPARPDAVTRGGRPARVKHRRSDRTRLRAPGVGGDAPRRALRRLSRPRCLLPAQPQGHAHPHGIRQDRLPAAPGPDLAQCPRWVAHQLRPQGPEQPDRAPSLPSMPRPNLRRAQALVAAFLRRPGRVAHGDQPARLLCPST